MLERFDLEKVFSAAQQAGYTFCEIFCETDFHTEIQIQGRIEDVRLYRQGGVSLRCFTEGSVRQFAGTASDTNTLLEWMRQGTVRTPASAASFGSDGLDSGFRHAPEITRFLSHLARSTWPESEGAAHVSLGFESQWKYFEVANSHGKREHGREEYAELDARWALEKGGRRLPFREERYASSVDNLLAAFRDDNPFRHAVRKSFAQLNPWPVPQGEIPVWWSPRAFSKLCMQFLRAFEGDLVLGNLSFLMDLPLPLSVFFSVEEMPDTDKLGCDHEGSPRRGLPVFAAGRPRGLATNNWVAEQLNVPSSGNCRRQSFRNQPTIGFWSPKVVGQNQVEGLQEKLDWGLSVRDLEILRFNPSTGEIRLRLKDVHLMHHGEEGEAVAPVDLQMNLTELLPTMRWFSSELETVGLMVQKNAQRLLTEVSAPAAMSEGVMIPGEVPTGNYW